MKKHQNQGALRNKTVQKVKNKTKQPSEMFYSMAQVALPQSGSLG